MLRIQKLSDLKLVGIEYLTGEADALSYRVLCDLTDFGRQVFCKAHGIPLVTDNLSPRQTRLAQPYNMGSKDNPHVASVMIDPYQWRTLAIIGLLDLECSQVLIYENGSVWGTEPDGSERVVDEGFWQPTGSEPFEGEWREDRVIYINGERQSWPYGWPDRIIENPTNKTYRNRHAMSGRVE